MDTNDRALSDSIKRELRRRDIGEEEGKGRKGMREREEMFNMKQDDQVKREK